MAYICSLASGSGGNALVLSCGSTHILLDAGISCLRIKKGLAQLGLSAEELSAVLITHPHSDHTSGLATFCKQYTVPVYASLAAAEMLALQIPTLLPRLRCFAAGDAFEVGEVLVQSFATHHDAAGSVDYRMDGDGFSFGALTDTGIIPDGAAEILPGVDTLLLESNHDVEWVESGPYPYYLKRRILGAEGHLNNEDAARFAVTLAESGAKQIVLAHLSAENNTPAMARRVVETALAAAEQTVEVTVAPRETCSETYTVRGRDLCRK